MKKLVPLVFFFLLASLSLHAQRKSDLIAEIDNLKSQIDSLNAEVFDARKNEKVAQAKSESFESQVTELQDANTTLMQNLNSFAEVSNKNSNIVNSAMESLEAKERQLKFIKDAISSNDSTTIVVLTNAKQTMGENAKIGVAEGSVTIMSKLEALFGKDTGTTITAESEAWVEKIANILKANPKTAITIEGLSMTGNLEVPAQQAMAVATLLQNKFAIAPERIMTLGRDGNLKEGVQISIHPHYNAFYLMVRENMKG